MHKHENNNGLINYILAGSTRRILQDEAKKITKTAYQCHPGSFNTDRPALPFILRYVPPYEKDFTELKKIQVKASLTARMFHEYHGYMIIDLSEYITHEKERYLDIALKYLRDMADCWAYIFIINTEPESARQMIENIAFLFAGLPLSCHIHNTQKDKAEAIQTVLEENGLASTSEAYGILLDLLERGILNDSQIRIAVREAAAHSPHLSAEALQKSLTAENSAIRYILSEKRYRTLIAVMEEKQHEHFEQQTI